jgi:protein-S-isoprenylcysteine O-methyltransferase Ste14
MSSALPSPSRHAALVQAFVSLLMGALWLLFAYRHVNAFMHDHNASYVLFCLSETLTAAFFVMRTTPASVSSSVLDWMLALTGTFLPLFLMPSPQGALPGASLVLIAGALLQIGGVVSLNRSFGLVAARRNIKTVGMYRFVRHPLYASYVVIFTAYVAANPSAYNAVLAIITIVCLLLRAVREERLLREDAAYRAYMQRVRYRIIPLVF